MNEEIYHVKAKLHVDTSELDAAEAKVDLLTEKLKDVADLITDLSSTDININADIVFDEENPENNDSVLEAVDDNFTKIFDILTDDQISRTLSARTMGKPVLVSGAQGPKGKTTLVKLLRENGIQAFEEWEFENIEVR
ncbi:hypothetical protein D922_03408 [Enterococcus faecalis 06-MB-DW-09]|nr:hypothetical protein D922_03408 [Enterococcus faecalis 06-MB-DW-09]